MRLLLDSHIFLNLDTNPVKVSPTQLIALEDVRNEVFVSAVTPWELGIKERNGKLIMIEPVVIKLARYRFTTLPITFAHAEHAASLPLFHRDPFDRMLIAQAIVEDLTLISSDAKFSLYPSLKLLS